jgi:luciferase family oxidoreductase group 1
MLPNHTSLVVAEQFGMLEALHPGRIDLGIGRAPGTDQLTALALRRSPEALGAEDFPAQLTELFGYFTGSWPNGHPFAAITAVPGRGDQPAVWLLGSSGYSAQVAAALGLPFAFAHHFAPSNTGQALELYRSGFQPSAALDRPRAMLGVAVTCAETDAQARRLAAPSALSFLRLRTGRPGTLPSPEEAESYSYSPAERDFVDGRMSTQVIGSPKTVRAGLSALLEETDADELMLTTTMFDPADRLRSFELVAEISGLTPAQAGPA